MSSRATRTSAVASDAVVAAATACILRRLAPVRVARPHPLRTAPRPLSRSPGPTRVSSALTNAVAPTRRGLERRGWSSIAAGFGALYDFRIGGAPLLRLSMCDGFVQMSVSVSDVRRASGRAYRSPRVWGDAPAVRYLFEISLLASLYYGSAKLGYALEFAGPVAAIVWLPVG